MISNNHSVLREIGRSPNILDEGNTEGFLLNNKRPVTTKCRLQVNNGSRSAEHPIQGDDIVSSNRKLLAVA